MESINFERNKSEDGKKSSTLALSMIDKETLLLHFNVKKWECEKCESVCKEVWEVSVVTIILRFDKVQNLKKKTPKEHI